MKSQKYLTLPFALLAVLLVAACAGKPAAPEGDARKIVPSARQPEPFSLPAYSVETLPNGMELVLIEKRDVPLVAFTLRLEGGALVDQQGREGTGDLLAELLTRGAGERDAQAFAETVAAVGGEFDAGNGIEALEIGGEFMSRDTELMLDLLHDVLREPMLDKDEFEKLRDRRIQQLAAMKDTSLRGLTGVYGDAFIYGGHPYGRPVGGSQASLAGVDYADLRNYFREHVGADRATLTVVGDFDADVVREQIEQRFGDWRAAPAPQVTVPDTSTQPGGKVLLVDKPGATQTYFAIGNTAVSREYENRAALDVVNTVFGGRFTSMLNDALRVKAGLTYGASSRVEQLAEGGAIRMVSFTATETTTAAIDLALDVLDRLHAEGLDETMLASAQTYILGLLPPDYETAADLSVAIAELEQLDLGADYVNNYGKAVAAVDLAATRDVIDNVYPTRNEVLFVLIGDADAIRDDISKYGEVIEMSIDDPHFSPSND
ncbi:MAG: pitrilysin family protein [Gammaproteobacteria bacterium]|nr:pitrilysin family protein [Gammaproteobacteria bacterium]